MNLIHLVDPGIERRQLRFIFKIALSVYFLL